MTAPEAIPQFSVQEFRSHCGKAHVYVENDMPVGDFHDFVLRLKGQMVDIMVNAQKEDERRAAEMSKIEPIVQADHFEENINK